MPKKKTDSKSHETVPAPARVQLITDTIEKNYMPYAMSVIISRAIPEIDGLKPAHRKLLYTMYKMGLLTGAKTKSANVVGQTMKLNPHGDASIYETLVRLTRGCATLLHPLIDSKGAFGKQYSSDMKYAAPRYTEVKLDTFCAELFEGIDKNAVDMVPNYDNTMLEPVLLPTTFPNILVTPNKGIAVGMASDICSFNLAEICDGTIALLRNPKITVDRMMEIVKAPDFPGGGSILYDPAEIRSIYETGSGSVRIRSRYRYDKDQNCIDIIEIPYSTTIELILKKITDLVKEGKIKEITDFRDEIDLNGFKLTLDLKKGVNPEMLMAKLFKMTPLEDSFRCNFNILVDSVPKQMGVIEILNEWIRFRMGCLKREFTYDLGKKKDKLHLLKGLSKILLDIDKAIRIIRKTEKEEDVIPNLMAGFDIDEVQADYVAEIKLRNLNRQYILNRIAEINDLQKEIQDLEDLLADDLKIKGYIAEQLRHIKAKYGIPRRSQIIQADTVEEYNEEEHVENYPVRLVLTREGYFKKITYRSLQGNDEQKVKDGDSVFQTVETENKEEVVFITNMRQLYRAKIADFENVKASVMGEFLPAKLGMDPGEKPMLMNTDSSYSENHHYIYLFENGKGVRVPASAYAIKGTRRKQTGVYSSSSPLVAAFYETEPMDLMLISDQDRAIVIKSTLIPEMASKTAGGVTLLSMKKGQKLVSADSDFASRIGDAKGYRKIKVPATGVLLEEKDVLKQQLSIDDSQ